MNKFSLLIIKFLEKILTVFGIERSLKVFEETQRIEAKGGLDIKVIGILFFI